jgi:riboflavin synthase
MKLIYSILYKIMLLFTGIVTSTGQIKKIEKNTKNRSAIKVSIDLGKDSKGLKIGQSVALNGVCLSATKITKNICTFEMIDETMKKTDLGNLKVGSLVNVERSLKVGERLEGHFVLGHVDGVAQIKKIEKKPKEVKIWFKIPNKLKKYVVKKGSIALDGISLTVVDVKNDLASVCLIPHTIEITNFKTKKIDDKLNIETDVLGKYILK